jgi:hypothetical protein
MNTTAAYPLTWPAGWKRTPPHQRHASNYKVQFGKARDELLHELCLLGARRQTLVLSTNIPLRHDGIPYANWREPQDPGVAVYWEQRIGGGWQQRVIACDSWRLVRENIRAVGLAIAALRTLERTKASEILERAFTGFAALPEAGTLPWWAAELGFGTTAGLTLEDVTEAYRRLAFERHPDRGGSDEAMARLNRAVEEARTALA